MQSGSRDESAAAETGTHGASETAVAVDVAVLAARLIGLALIAHGAQKVSGLFGGRGLVGTAAWMEARGFRPGRLFALLAGLSLMLGGLLIALGLGGPIGPMLAVAALVVALVAVTAPAGFFSQNKGCETTLVYLLLIVLLAVLGYGEYSLDALLHLSALWTPHVVGIAIATGAAAGLLATFLRRQSAGA